MKRMPTIKGTPLESRELSAFHWNRDLVAFDGPLLSLYKDDEGGDHLVSWVDCSKTHHRWILAAVSRSQLLKFVRATVTLKEIITSKESVVVFETTKKAQKRNGVRVAVGDLPTSYLPAQDSYLADEICTRAALELRVETPKDYRLGLDGDLYFDDFALIPKLYMQLYAFHYALAHMGTKIVKETLDRLMRPWNGGINVVNMLSGIQAIMPSIHRAKVASIAYASPGHIKLNLLSNLAEEISQTAKRIESPADFRTTEILYRDIYSYFRDQELGGFDNEDAMDRELSPSQSRRIKALLGKFLASLGWQDQANAFSRLDVDSLSQLRVVLAYYRRVRKLRNYVVEKKLTM